jgi:two-component system, NarL family, sensor histidine kinase LiaS
MGQQKRTLGQEPWRRLTWGARLSGLGTRLTLAYMWVTAVLVLVLEILAVIGLLILLFSVILPFTYTLVVRQTAERYAFAASLQAKGSALDPQSTFQENQPGTLALPGTPAHGDFQIPYTAANAPKTHPFAFALVIAPDGHILASSYPQRYPLQASASLLLPHKASLIAEALEGIEGSGQDLAATGRSIYAAEPAWSRARHPLGAIYVQMEAPSVQDVFAISPDFFVLVGVSGLVMLLVLAPIGGLFGRLTMQGLVQRIRTLVTATSHVAGGKFTQQVRVGRRDELGQLEQSFNRMAHQLAESTRQQRLLTEQNARLAERARMSRDLHDSVKQQVFALATQIGTALALLDKQREETRPHLEMANELAYLVRQELTSLIQELRPSALVEKGLSQALRDEMVRWSRQSSIKVDFHLQDVPEPPLSIAEELLRVVQETLSNAARHSQATQVQLTLKQEQEQVMLTISDSGCGFDPATVSSQSLGLRSMKERMESIGGTLLLQSSSGQGTRIVACYPLIGDAKMQGEQERRDKGSKREGLDARDYHFPCG